MKNRTILKKSLSLLLCLISFVLIFSSCDKKGEDANTSETTDEDNGLSFETPEVNLSGNSVISLLDKGETPAVKVGPFDISSEFIMTYLKKTVLDSGMKQSAKTAANRIATIYYKERALAGTDLELKSEYVSEIIDSQEESFNRDEEANLYNCENLGLTKQEFMDFVSMSEVEAYLDARYLDEIFEYIEKTYKKKYGKEGSAAEVSEYYPHFMIAIARKLDYSEANKDVIKNIEKDFDLWIKTYVDSGENLS